MSVVGSSAYTVALAVFAFEQGGAAAVALIGVIQLVPSAIAAPFAGALGDRYRRERVMLAADLVRAVAFALGAAVLIVEGPASLVYALSAVVAVARTASVPARVGLVPALARTPQQLTASNVAFSTVESVGDFAIPALAALLLVATSEAAVFAVTAGTFLVSALLVGGIRRQARAAAPAAHEPVARSAVAGFQTVARDARLRLIVGLYGAQTLVAGAFRVLIVVMALELLELGESGVGFLNSAVGVGGLLGAVAAASLVGRGRLAPYFALGIVLWGAPLTLVGLWPDATGALVLLALLGVGNTLVDVTALTLMQRVVPDAVLSRVFGALQTTFMATIALGGVLVSVLLAAFGDRAALVVTGAFLPLLAVVTWRRVAALDAGADVPTHGLALLREIPLFAPLPALPLEHLASNLIRLHVPSGTEVIRAGDVGDRFYIVDAGELDVLVDGRASSLGPGDFFGEIALLRDIPRTATVVARTDVELYALERDDFVGAVTGHPASVDAADAIIGARLGTQRSAQLAF